MLRLLADEHIPYPVVEGLRRRGVDIDVVQRVGLRSTDDAEILAFASQQQRVVYTCDADYVRLSDQGIAHRGILFHHQKRYSIGEAIRQVAFACEALLPEEMINRVEFL